MATSDSNWWILAPFALPLLINASGAGEHRDAQDADDVEHRGSNGGSPVLGKPQDFDIGFGDFGRHGAT
jgi:hypothetical protein